MWERVRKGLTAVFCGQMIIVVGNLLLVPLYLTHWSAAVYGEWLALFSLVSYLSTLDLGMNMAVVNRLTQAYARSDLEEYARSQHSAMVFYLVLAGGGSLLLAVAAWLVPIPAWLGLRETPPREAAWVMWLLGSQVLWALPAGLVSAVYRTTGNLTTSQWIGNVQRVVALVLVALVLVIGGSLKAVALIQLVPLIMVIVFVWWDVRRRFPVLAPGISQASMPVVRELVVPSLLFLLIMVANSITQQGTVLVVASAIGGIAVAVFVISRTLASLIRQVVGSLNVALWPDLTGLEARLEHARLRVVHRLLVVGSTTLCIAVAAALWHDGSEVITVWTRGRLEPDLTLLRLLLVQLVLQSPWLASSVFTAAANRHERLSWSYLISAVVGVGTAALLVKWMGTWAVPVGLIVGEALACYHFVVRDTCQMVGEPYGPFARRLWFGLAVVATVAIVAGWAAHETIPGPSFIRWAGVGAFTSAVSAAVAWGVWLTPEDRAVLLSRLRPLVALVGDKAWSIRS